MYKKLTRSNTERMLASVLGGIALYFRIDPTLVRLGYVVFLVLSAFFPAALVYVIAAVMIPNESGVR